MPTSGVCPSCHRAGWLRRKIAVSGKFAERTYECANCGYSWVEAVPRDSSVPTPGKNEPGD